MPDVEHLIPDRVVLSLSRSLPGAFWTASRGWYRWYWEWVLGVMLTQDETNEILSRINGFGPQLFENTWEGMSRNAKLSFWRTPGTTPSPSSETNDTP